MTRARAPGKVVLSGAYAVLHGAPAMVAAVGRHARADTAASASFVTEEVGAALRSGEAAPSFDASELRDGERKLGLGSSAAILVASLFALERAADAVGSEGELRQRVFERALSAHRRAQGGGSGVDVAASTFGGTLAYRLSREGPRVESLALPAQLSIEIWICPESSSTRGLLEAVRKLGERAPEEHDRLLGAQAAASERALAAAQAGELPALVAALGEQYAALRALGRAANVAIVTPELDELSRRAAGEDAAVLPAGAGGGDLTLFVGARESSEALRSAFAAARHRRLAAELSVPGVATF